MPTAIIVNDRGEVFCGWAYSVWLSVNGYEEGESVPVFLSPRQLVVRSNDLRPVGVENGDTYWVNLPKVYGSERAANRAMQKLDRLGCGRIAVVS